LIRSAAIVIDDVTYRLPALHEPLVILAKEFAKSLSPFATSCVHSIV